MTRTTSCRFNNAREKALIFTDYAVGTRMTQFRDGEFTDTTVTITAVTFSKSYKSNPRHTRKPNMIDVTWTAE